MTTRRIAKIALFTAMALIMHIIESMLPPLMSFAPGAKIGLSNVVSLIALVVLGASDAFAVVVSRCLLGALYGRNPFALVYSLPSAVLALVVMAVLYRVFFPKISLMSISLAGAVSFNFVQLVVAGLLVRELMIVSILPLMALASFAAGLFVGLLAHYTIKNLPWSVYD